MGWLVVYECALIFRSGTAGSRDRCVLNFVRFLDFKTVHESSGQSTHRIMNVMLGESDILATLVTAWWSLLEVCFALSMPITFICCLVMDLRISHPFFNYLKETDP